MSPAPTPPGRRRRSQLDRRTVGISMCIALIAALTAGLVVSISNHDGASSEDTKGSNVALTPTGKVDTATALRTRLVGFNGRSTTLTARVTSGRPAVVNFFSSTCVPCVTEMPAFERVHRSRHDVSFIGIDVQDPVAAGRKLINRTGITYEALRDPPGDLLRSVGGVGLPTTLLIDAKGRVVATHTGALSERSLRTLISSKLG